jgi:hypothetical protein
MILGIQLHPDSNYNADDWFRVKMDFFSVSHPGYLGYCVTPSNYVLYSGVVDEVT